MEGQHREKKGHSVPEGVGQRCTVVVFGWDRLSWLGVTGGGRQGSWAKLDQKQMGWFGD
jgi:hypothetical protein